MRMNFIMLLGKDALVSIIGLDKEMRTQGRKKQSNCTHKCVHDDLDVDRNERVGPCRIY